MGNEISQLKGIEIDQNAVDSNDFWTLFYAELPRDNDNNHNESQHLSIFRGEAIVNGQLWAAETPLERAIKNLKRYRHPFILKYVNEWVQGSRFLATERVRPLSSVLSSQNSIQVCLGLKNILTSLIFLLEHANVRHINIALPSIYIKPNGEWRLGGFEFVWKSAEFKTSYLELSDSWRYKAAICRNEGRTSGVALEQFAFAVLCQDTLKNFSRTDIPYINEFREYCVTLKSPNCSLRPKLSEVLSHPFFNHDFILIHSFLSELPLKTPQEKQDFFTGLVDRLRKFDDATVASQMGSLLLSRMVLLDATAQLCVLPYVFRIKTDIFPGIFSQQTFINVMIPQIKHIFAVLDLQIRMLLLEYFQDYVPLMNKDELREDILPALIVGIKDTNDALAAKTLHCLAELVPILSAAVVIGCKRRRYFADGRPQSLPDASSHSQWIEPRSITPVMSPGQFMTSVSPLPDNNGDVSDGGHSINSLGNMPPRLSPIGGEALNESLSDSDEHEETAWSDWENDIPRVHERPSTIIEEDSRALESIISPSYTATSFSKAIDDIAQLGIQITPKTTESEELDFFKDMEPVIETTKTLTFHNETHTPNPNSNDKTRVLDEEVSVNSSRFEIAVDEIIEDGWGNDDDWDEH